MSLLEVRIARSTDEAAERVAAGYVPLAGGTDLVPRARLGLLEDARIVVVRRLEELWGIREVDGGLWIGATTPLAEIAASASCPAWLRAACREVASPRVRELATIGGNLLQDRRCRYLHRPPLWRTASGACLRTGGVRCLAKGAGCVAQQRSLVATVMVAVGASLEIVGEGASQRRSLSEVYPTSAEPRWSLGGLLAGVFVPDAGNVRVAFESIRRRASIDYHDLVVAGARRGDEWAIALGASLPYPRQIAVEEPRAALLAEAASAMIPSGEPGSISASYARRAAAELCRRVVARLLP